MQYAARAGPAAGRAATGCPRRAVPEESALAVGQDRRRRTCSSATSGLEAKIAQRLEGAGSAWRPAEWLLFHAGVFLVISILGLLLGGGNLIIGLIFMAVGAIGPWLYLGLPAQAAQEEVRGRAARHAAADVRLARGRSLAGPVRRHHRP